MRLLLVGGPMYDPLYDRFPEFEEREGVEIEAVVAPTHPDLNDRIAEEFGSGTARYDLISTHTKYAPSQVRWLTPLDDDLQPAELEPFDARTLELARIDGALYSVPRNLDVKLLLYRTDLMDGPPGSWEELRDEAGRLRTGDRVPYGFVFPGKESWPVRPLLRVARDGRRQDVRGRGSPGPTLNDEAGRWALGLLKDLYDRAAPAEVPDWHYDEVAACFRGGGAATSTDWPGGFYTYADPAQSAIADRFDVALYPEGSAGRYIYSSSHTFAIPETVRDRAAAVELLRFLISRDSQTYEAQAWHPAGALRRPGRRARRCGAGFSRGAAVGPASGGARGGPDPTQTPELPGRGGRHLAGRQGGAPRKQGRGRGTQRHRGRGASGGGVRVRSA